MAWDEEGLRAMHEEAKKLVASLPDSQKDELVLNCCRFACVAGMYEQMEVGLFDSFGTPRYSLTRVQGDAEKRVRLLGELLRVRAETVFDR